MGNKIVALGLIGSGIALMLVGGATMAFGANEVIAAATGTSYIQQWTGMSDMAYGWTYFGLNIASAVGSIAGNAYMKYNPRYPGRNPNKIPDGFKDRPNPKANYYNPKTGQSLGPDLYHPGPIGPHWDWKDSKGQWWRIRK